MELDPAERELLLTAALADWSGVEPAVFGGLFTGTIATERRRAQGAHYTPAAEIQKLVQPTIVRPWRERIEAAENREQALALLGELSEFRVLDPACGCGNFLYIAYRELRHLERDLLTRVVDLHRADGVKLPDEDYLPLEDLPGIQVADALKIEWPRCEAIVSNPPFVGDRMLRSTIGDAEIDYLKKTFGIGVKDYCVYWFRKAHDHLLAGQRAGLVGTNSVAQNRGRAESLQYIAANGGVITDAVTSQDWPGEASVDVSLVNWIRDPTNAPATYLLDGQLLGEPISPSLRPLSLSVDRAVDLATNQRHAFYGCLVNGEGFVLTEQEAEGLHANGKDWRQVVRPYLDGRDLLNSPGSKPTRWVIDLFPLSLEDAESSYADAVSILRERVKPHRDRVKRKLYRERWWLFAEPVPGMRSAIEALSRFIAAPQTGKRTLFAWQQSWTCPSHATTVFAFDDDYAMGVLSSTAHTAWSIARCSTLEDRLRYTPTTVFMSFPWPDRTEESVAAIGAASTALIDHRDRLCIERGIGLTKLYNEVDEGAHRALRGLHRDLDRAVADAYGWPRRAAEDADEIVRRLLERNLAISRGEISYAPFPDETPDAAGPQTQLGA